MIVCDELLYRLVMTDVSEIAEDGHEAFRLERIAVDIHLCGRFRLEDDTLVLYLVGEEGSNDGEETRNEIVVSDYVQRHRWDREKLKSEVFDRRFRFSVNEQICIDHTVIHVCEMAGYGNAFEQARNRREMDDIPTASLCALVRVNTDA